MSFVLVPRSNDFRNIEIGNFAFERWYVTRGTELTAVTVIYKNTT